MDPDEIPVLNATAMKGRPDKSGKDSLPTVVRMEYTAPDGRKLQLCDFGSAGEGGSPYHSWLRVEQIEKTHFALDNPLRSRTPRIATRHYHKAQGNPPLFLDAHLKSKRMQSFHLPILKTFRTQTQ